MDAVALIQELSRREKNNSRIQNALQEATEIIGEGLESLETLLTDVCDNASDGLRETCHHIIDAGGKRIRPAICLLAFRAAGGRSPWPLDLATVCELLHNATLLHDDVVDDGQVRRGHPAAKMVYGNALSVLGGDYLLVHTVDIVAKRSSTFMQLFVQTMRELIEGELIQLKCRGSVRTTRAEYAQIVEGKTASLFRWAAQSGAGAADSAIDTKTGAQTISQKLGQFGWHVGVAFQVIDDILDLSAETSELGKNLLADIHEGKMTLPIILAAEGSPQLRQLLEQMLNDPLPEQLVPQVVDLVHQSGALDTAKQTAAEHTQKALQLLDSSADFEPRSTAILEELATALLERRY